MSARLRSLLHPLTVASIDMQKDCSCGPFGKSPALWLCEYHMGFEDGIDALFAARLREVRSDG